MLFAYQDVLNTKKIFLCSQSKARRSLLESMCLQVEVFPSSFEENLDKNLFPDPKDYVLETCHGKVKDVLEKFKTQNVNWDIAIFCDTIIVLDGKIVEKPESPSECAAFLRSFRNKAQEVHTACYVLFNDSKHGLIEQKLVDTSKVIFGDIPEECIEAYSQTNYYKGKCGGYGIQDAGISFIEKIEGQSSTVIGLPAYQLCSIIISNIKKLNWNITQNSQENKQDM